MKDLHLILILLITFATTSLAQQEYADQLERAKRLYEQGRLEQAISYLRPAQENGNIPRPVRREMLAVLQEAYLFLDQQEKADSIHLQLLRLDPFFRQNTDIPEVRYLVEGFETYPVATYGFRLGFYAFSRPLVDQRFAAFPDQEIGQVNYKRRSDDLYGWTVNADISFNLFRSGLELAGGIGISNIYLRRNLEIANARLESGGAAPALVSFLERQRWTQIPFLLKVNGLSRSAIITSRFVPYICAGVASEFLIKGAAKAIGPEIDFAGTDDDRSASLLSIRDQRKRFNVALLAGLGGKFRFKRSYFVLDLRYHRLLQNIASNSNRFSNEVLVNTFNYVDDDFRMHNLNISLGMGVFLFRSVKK